MTLDELQTSLEKSSQSGTLTLTETLIGTGRLTDFLNSLPRKKVDIVRPVFFRETVGSPGRLIVTGVLSETWTIPSFSSGAVASISTRWTFVEANQGQVVQDSLWILSCFLVVANADPIPMSGFLAHDEELDFVLEGNGKLVSMTPFLDFAADPALNQILASSESFGETVALLGGDLSFGWRPLSSSKFHFVVQSAADWSIFDQVAVKSFGLDVTVERDGGQSPLASFSATFFGTLTIASDWNVALTFLGGSRWELEVLPKGGSLLPGLSDLAEFAGGDQLKNSVAAGLRLLGIDAIFLDDVRIGFDFALRKLMYLSLRSHLVLAGVQVNLYTSLPNFQFDGAMAPSSVLKLTDLITTYFGTADGFPQITVESLSFSARPEAGFYILDVTLNDDWSIPLVGTASLSLTQVSVHLEKSSAGISGTISTVLTLAGIDLFLLARSSKTAGKTVWQFQGRVNETQSIPIGDFISSLASSFGSGVTLPKSISEWTLQDLRLSFDPFQKDFSFSCTGVFPLGNATPAIALNVTLNAAEGSYLQTLDGTLTLAGAVFSLELSAADQGTKATAVWKEVSGESLGMDDVVRALGLEVPEIPPGLSLRLTSASFTYDTQGPSFTLTATTIGGTGVLAAFKNTQGEWKIFFGLGVGRSMNLSNLPLVGHVFDPSQSLGISDFQVLLATDSFDGSEAQAINALIAPLATQGPLVPAVGMRMGFALSASLTLGTSSLPLLVPLSEGSALLPSPKTDAAATSSAAPASDGTIWLNVQKSFGPVNFQRVGIKYSQGVLWFSLDASLQAGGLTISLFGLGIGSTLSDFEPQFHIQGLGLDYSGPGLQIDGSFLEIPPVAPITLNFGGGAVIQLEAYSLSAVGSYAQFGGQTSLFVFATVRGTFASPPAFEITGLAAGFGYNSGLRIPNQDEIFQFPLVAGISNPDALGGPSATPLQALAKLMDGTSSAWIAPQAGNVWLAAGVLFNTYQLVDTTALLVGEFGKTELFALIGLSRARFPKDGPETYAYVELQFEAYLAPEEGVLSLTAVLSPNSFVIDPACHLTGGFAVVFWFGENPHADDFVITLGGYSPYFQPPSWYPQEPRLGFNWALDSHVTIDGEAYFALTPSAIMAGGALDVVYRSGNLKAWFSAHADLIVWWNPFHFIAGIGVSVGASYKIDFLFFSTTFTVELGADLTLWGPPTGGTVTVHWWILSFTVDFGNSISSGSDVQTWDQFTRVLPPAPKAVRFRSVSGLASPVAPSATSSAAVPLSENWRVRASGFRFTCETAVPAQHLYLGSTSTVPFQSGSPLNIKPMAQTGLTSSARFSLFLNDNEIDWLDSQRPWRAAALKRSVPGALWGTGSNTELVSTGQELIADQLCGLDLAVPLPILGSSPGSIDMEADLSYDPLKPGTVPFQQQSSPSGPLPRSSDQTLIAIADIMGLKTQRDLLFQTFGPLGLPAVSNGDLSLLARAAGSSFVDEPLLLGV